MFNRGSPEQKHSVSLGCELSSGDGVSAEGGEWGGFQTGLQHLLSFLPRRVLLSFEGSQEFPSPCPQAHHRSFMGGVWAPQ